MPEVLKQGDMVQKYRELCAKDKRGWYGPAKFISISGKDITLLHDNRMISAHHRDVRKIRNDFEFKWRAKPLTEKMQKQKMANRETNGCEQSLIKRNQNCRREVKKTQCRHVMVGTYVSKH